MRITSTTTSARWSRTRTSVATSSSFVCARGFLPHAPERPETPGAPASGRQLLILEREIEARGDRPIDQIAYEGDRLQVDLRLRIKDRFLVRQIVDIQRRTPPILCKPEARIDEPVRRQVDQESVDVEQRDGLAVRGIGTSADVIALERSDQ